MQMTIDRIIEQRDWRPLDAVIFPGSYIRLTRLIAHLSPSERVRAIGRESFAKKLVAAAERLDRYSRGALLILGADASDPKRQERGDQTCIAVSRTGVIGLARKIFPANGDTTHCWFPYVPNLADYDSAVRVIRLPSGHRALLCACYDMFALAPDRNKNPRGSPSIRDLWIDGSYHHIEQPGFAQLRNVAITRWLRFLQTNRIDLAVSAIHGFQAPGRDVYWQRHGLTAASAALGGSLAIGAAHFNEQLPAPNKSTLAAFGVPKSEIGTGFHRPSYSLEPIDHLTVTSGPLKALVRLYSPT
jgi:hypothetical protein